MRIRTAAAVGCATGCVALAVAACASASVGVSAHLATSARPGTPARPAQSPQQVAGADAASMLAAFRPPPGAERSGPIDVAPLSSLLDTEGPDAVIRTVWWRVPGTMHAVFAWVTAHRPSGLTFAGRGTLGDGGITAESETYSLPPVPGVILDRSLNVYVASDGADSAAIWVDSKVAWLPPKPSAERIPAAARAVTITALPGVNVAAGGTVGRDLPPVTVTDPATVASIAKVVDGLPVMPPDFESCPEDAGQALRLTFRAAEDGPVLAQVTGEMTGCTPVSVVIDGKQMPTLWYGVQMDRQVLKLAGIHWAGYS